MGTELHLGARERPAPPAQQVPPPAAPAARPSLPPHLRGWGCSRAAEPQASQGVAQAGSTGEAAEEEGRRSPAPSASFGARRVPGGVSDKASPEKFRGWIPPNPVFPTGI